MAGSHRPGGLRKPRLLTLSSLFGVIFGLALQLSSLWAGTRIQACQQHQTHLKSLSEHDNSCPTLYGANRDWSLTIRNLKTLCIMSRGNLGILKDRCARHCHAQQCYPTVKCTALRQRCSIFVYSDQDYSPRAARIYWGFATKSSNL
jgi:hypothetical protein